MKAISGLLLLALGSTATLLPTAGDQTALIKGYRGWKLATTKPQDMTPQLALSCAMQSKWNSPPNPHVPRVFVVYVNKAGEKAMLDTRAKSYPDDTVIVKEKYIRSQVSRKDEPYSTSVDPAKLKKAKPELVTVMVKRDGKWEYFAIGNDGKLIKGDTKHCQSCHLANKENDFVFRPYVTGAAQPRYRR